MNLSLKSISSPSPVIDRSPALRWRIVLLLMALCFISHFNRISMTVAGNERIMPSHNIKTTQMSWVYDSFLIVYTIFMAAGGAFIDRVGVRLALTTMALGSGLFAVITGLTGFVAENATTVFLSLLIVRAMMGIMT